MLKEIETMSENHPCLKIGDKAPPFEANTTKGWISFPRDFQGKWVILFSHPSDFSPVCTTEFIFFAEMMKEFELLNTSLIGLSVDTLSSHLGWLYTIEDQISFHGITKTKIRFPLIADLSGKIAKQYGMIHPNSSETKTIRSVYFIDPQSVIRTILFYPLSTGRNFEELKRILISLQLSDRLGVSTPANWQPGDDIVKKAPDTIHSLEKCVYENKKKSGAWFLSLEELPIEEINKILYLKKPKPN